MSEPIWCYVRFKCPTSWGDPPPFVTDAAEALINGEGPVRDWSGYGWTIWSVNGEGNYGLTDDNVLPVLRWCEDHRVPYTATGEGKYDISAEAVVFDGDEAHTAAADNEGQAVLTESQWADIRHKPWTLEAIAAYFKPFLRPLEDIPIEHLPEQCPAYEGSDQ